MHKCRYSEQLANGKIQNSVGQCDHEAHEHKSGTCWHITNPDLADVNTNAKYCKCSHNPGNIKTFEELGYMESQQNDYMITKECSSCEHVLLINVDRDVCQSCTLNNTFK